MTPPAPTAAPSLSVELAHRVEAFELALEVQPDVDLARYLPPPGHPLYLAVLGELIAHAMVGTFLGILLAYGFVGPFASRVERCVSETVKVFECVKVTLLASMNGYPPQLAVEFGRKVLFAAVRPSFTELEEHVRQTKAAGGKA